MVEGYEYVDALPDGLARGRGAGLNPGNRFEGVRLHVLGEHLDRVVEEDESGGAGVHTEVLADRSQTIINRVDSPDVGFNWSINPYRGCEHGCIYCYARPFHELLGYSSGLDFETKIVAKFNAATLLRKELNRPRWKGETIAMSGVTDCYQPIEKELRITRGCLEVITDFRQPIGIVTKNRLVLRDLDLLQELAGYGAVRVVVSLTSLDAHLAGKMEPRASSPADRLHTISKLSEAGIPTVVMVAPVIPGLNDKEIPALLGAGADAGALGAHYVLLRLPYQIKALFCDWLERYFPERATHVQSLLRGARGGKLYNSGFGDRMRGQGPVAEQIGRVFGVFRRRYGLDRSLPKLSSGSFRRQANDGQMTLFNE